MLALKAIEGCTSMYPPRNGTQLSRG